LDEWQEQGSLRWSYYIHFIYVPWMDEWDWILWRLDLGYKHFMDDPLSLYWHFIIENKKVEHKHHLLAIFLL